MSRLLPTLLLLLAMLPASAQTSARQKSLGVTAGYVSHNRSASAGLAFDYAFSSHLVLAPSIDIVFPHHKASAGFFNLDLRIPFRFSSPSTIEFYPLTGINVNAWKFGHPKGEEAVPDERVTRLGFNLGAGLQCHLTPSLKLFLQARHTFTRHTPSTAIQLGISHVF